MPTPQTALLYRAPAFEHQPLRGPGHDHAFELVGAPWIDPLPAGRCAQRWSFPGVRFRPAFSPDLFKAPHDVRRCTSTCGEGPGPAGARAYLRRCGLAPSDFAWLSPAGRTAVFHRPPGRNGLAPLRHRPRARPRRDLERMERRSKTSCCASATSSALKTPTRPCKTALKPRTRSEPT